MFGAAGLWGNAVKGGAKGEIVKDRSQRAIQSTPECVSYGTDVCVNVCNAASSV